MRKLIRKALSISKRAHAGQKRWGGQPYYTHPKAVGEMFDAKHDFGKRCRVVGYLHDVIEDTKWTIDDIRKEGFPEDILEALRVITRSKKKSYFDYLLRVQKNDIACLTKIADLTNNLIDVIRFKKTYYRDRNLLARHILMQTHGMLFNSILKKDKT